MSLINKSNNKKVLVESINNDFILTSKSLLFEPMSMFSTNNDFEVNIKTEETLNEQMNKIFTKYSDIKIKLDNLKKNKIR